MAKLGTILYLIQFMCPYVLGFEVKVNDVDVAKKNRAEKLCELYQIHQRIPKLWIQIFTIF